MYAPTFVMIYIKCNTTSGKQIFEIRKPSKFNVPGWSERAKELNALAERLDYCLTSYRYGRFTWITEMIMKFLSENEDRLRSPSMLTKLQRREWLWFWKEIKALSPKTESRSPLVLRSLVDDVLTGRTEVDDPAPPVPRSLSMTTCITDPSRCPEVSMTESFTDPSPPVRRSFDYDVCHRPDRSGSPKSQWRRVSPTPPLRCPEVSMTTCITDPSPPVPRSLDDDMCHLFTILNRNLNGMRCTLTFLQILNLVHKIDVHIYVYMCRCNIIDIQI